MSKQDEKARLGAIGEHNVCSILMEKDWDAFNANANIKNYKSIDIVCLKYIDGQWKPETAFIQVKTCKETNIPIGFTVGECYSRTLLEKRVMGPYVFVRAIQRNGEYEFRYFILSRSQFIELAHQSHVFYMERYKNRAKDPDPKAPAGLYVRWLEGKSDPETDKHYAFHNPLNCVSCENCWDNIWKD